MNAMAPNVLNIGPVLRRVVLRLIDQETDPAEKKQRIIIAYETGHLTAEEAEDWIVAAGLIKA